MLPDSHFGLESGADAVRRRASRQFTRRRRDDDARRDRAATISREATS